MLWLGGILFVSACTPITQPTQPNLGQNQTLTLNSGMTIGQTFVARNNGLAGFSIFLVPNSPSEGELLIRVWSNPEQTDMELATGRLALSSVTAPAYYTISFPTLSDSRSKYYYVDFVLTNNSQVDFGVNAANSYFDGSLYQNNSPQASQLAFNLIYEPKAFFWGLLGEFIFWMIILLVGIALLVFPGLALLLWADSQALQQRHWAEVLGLSCAISIAVYPILVLLTNLIGLKLGVFYAWGPITMSIIFLLWRFRTWRTTHTPSLRWQIWFSSQDAIPNLIAIITLSLIIGQRFWIIRNLDFPLWNDSYHHTLIVQLLSESGGLFTSWGPSVPFETFTYHFGFHSNASNLVWVLGLSAPEAVLWMGQLINIAGILTLIPLARWLNPNRWSVALVLLIAGLLSAMPNFYVNWGRYTQLTGQAILPVALIYIAHLFDEPQIYFGRRLLLGIITIGGLSLTHFRVLIFVVLFCCIWFLLFFRRRDWRIQLTAISMMSVGSFSIFFPWLLNSLSGNLTRDVVVNLITPDGTAQTRALMIYNTIFDWRDFMPAWVWFVSLGALGWNLWRQSRKALGIILWSGSLLLFANPDWLGLSGQGNINNFAVQIFAYIPATVLVASTGELLAMPFCSRSLKFLGIIGFFLVGGWGAYQRWTELRPVERQLVTRPDLRAMEWLSVNTSPESVLLINGRFELVDQYVVGTDGAWLAPLLAHRQVTIPPMLYTTERLKPPLTVANIHAVTRMALAGDVNQSSFWEAMRLQGITHVFIGQRQGKVLNDGTTFVPEQLNIVPDLELVYHSDQVWIFALMAR